MWFVANLLELRGGVVRSLDLSTVAYRQENGPLLRLICQVLLLEQVEIVFLVCRNHWAIRSEQMRLHSVAVHTP